VYTSGFAGLFGLSAMQITRAVKQLNELGLFTTYKDGTQVVIEGTDNGADLFAKAILHLMNPVRNLRPTLFEQANYKFCRTHYLRVCREVFSVACD
jgi:DNA-binding MarR family transcriptional regulator